MKELQAAELNGVVGSLGEFMPRSGWWAVLVAGRELALWPRNLFMASGDVPAGYFDAEGLYSAEESDWEQDDLNEAPDMTVQIPDEEWNV